MDLFFGNGMEEIGEGAVAFAQAYAAPPWNPWNRGSGGYEANTGGEPREMSNGQKFYMYLRWADGDSTTYGWLRSASQYLEDMLQLRLLLTAVNAFHRSERITSAERGELLQKALNRASHRCESPYDTASFRIVLDYAMDNNLIDKFDKYVLESKAIESQIEHSDYIQHMKRLIQQNSQRIGRVEVNVRKLQENVEQIRKAFQRHMQIQAATSFVAAAVNLVSLGAGGTVLQNALALTLGRAADLADIGHLQEVIDYVETVVGSNSLSNISVKDSFEYGLSLAEGRSEDRLREALCDEKGGRGIGNPFVFLAVTSRSFVGKKPWFAFLFGGR